MNQLPPHNERRTEDRIDARVRVRYARLNRFFVDYTRNLGSGGMFIHTTAPAPVGSHLEFQIIAPRLAEPLVIPGEVRWIVPEDAVNDPSEAGMGIAFAFPNPDAAEDVDERVRSLMRDVLGPLVTERLMEAKRTDKT